MRCKTVQGKLDLYLAEELATADQRQVEAHLRSCPDCRAESVRLRELVTLLKGDTAVPPVPEGFSSRVVAKASERLAARQPSEMPVPGSIRRWWASVSFPMRAEAAAVLAAGLLIGVLMGQQTWRSVHPSMPQGATQADVSAIYELDYLSDAPAGSLSQAYLALTRTP
jgi:anti-sigma factor RsiW